MAMLLLIMIALPGADSDATDLAALTTSRYKEHTREADFAYAPCDATRLLPYAADIGDCIDLATSSSPYRGSTSGNPLQGFSYILAPGHGIAIGQTSTSFDSMYTLRHGGQFPGEVLVDCVDAPDESLIEFLNDEVEDVTVYFIVDASSSGEAGAFTLEWLLYMVGKDQTIVMTHLWPEPRPRQGRVLNIYTPLPDSHILKVAVNLWVSDQAAATSTYGPVNTWDVANVINMYQSKSIRILENDLACVNSCNCDNIMMIFRAFVPL